MPYNGSGTFTVYTPGTPFVTGTTISSTVANNVNTDFATGLSNAITRDGQSTTTQRIAFAQGISNGSQTLTALADGTQLTHAATVGQLQSGAVTSLSNVAGTNTITADSTPALAAYAANKAFTFIPANDNTGATTIDISSVGAKSIFWSGAACVGGELKANIPVTIFYDGTQFNILGNGFNAPFVDTQAIVEGGTDRTKKVRIEADGITTATTRVITMPDKDVTLADATDLAGGLIELATLAEVQTGTDATRAVTASTLQNGKIVINTPVATTSTSAISISTAIPSWAKRLKLLFNAVSLSGTSDVLVQIGPSGGVENTGYVSESTITPNAGSNATSTSTAGFIIRLTAAASSHSGCMTLNLSGTANTWIAEHTGRNTTASTVFGAGKKTAAGTVTQITIASANGSDTFDAGDVTLVWE